MTYAEALKSGFSLLNRKLQLVAVQAALMVINCLGFFIMVGIPLGIAFILFGLDLTGIAGLNDIPDVLRNPAELFSKYFALALIVITGILLYFLVVATLGLYVFGGSVGIIGKGFTEPNVKFSMRSFFSEAKRMFFPVMRFASVIALVFLGIAFVFGLFGGIISAVVSGAKSQDSTLALFLGIFFSLILVLAGLVIVIGTLAVAVYGIACLFFKGSGAVRSFREALRFLWDNPYAFWLYLILFAGYVFVSFLLILISFPFKFIPIVGGIISFPIQIMSYLVQSYLGLLVIAVVFAYYFDTEVKKPETSVEAPPAPTGADSTPDGDISDLQGHRQEDIPPQREENSSI